jgi:hypothetical protein
VHINVYIHSLHQYIYVIFIKVHTCLFIIWYAKTMGLFNFLPMKDRFKWVIRRCSKNCWILAFSNWLHWLRFKYFNRLHSLFSVPTIHPLTWGQPCKLMVSKDKQPMIGWKGDWFESKAASVIRWQRSSLRSSKTGHPWRTPLITVLLNCVQSERFSDS